jgi:hypothetical protein
MESLRLNQAEPRSDFGSMTDWATPCNAALRQWQSAKAKKWRLCG